MSLQLLFTSEPYAHFEEDGMLDARTPSRRCRPDVSRDRRQDA